MPLKLFSRRNNTDRKQRAPVTGEGLPSTLEQKKAQLEAEIKFKQAQVDWEVQRLRQVDLNEAKRLSQEWREEAARKSQPESSLALAMTQKNNELVSANKRDFAKLRAYAATQEAAREAAALRAAEVVQAEKLASVRSESYDSYVTAPEPERWNAWVLEEMRRIRLARVPDDDSSTICTIRSFHTAVEYLS